MSTEPDSWHCTGRTVDLQVQMVHKSLDFFFFIIILNSWAFLVCDGYIARTYIHDGLLLSEVCQLCKSGAAQLFICGWLLLYNCPESA